MTTPFSTNPKPGVSFLCLLLYVYFIKSTQNIKWSRALVFWGFIYKWSYPWYCKVLLGLSLAGVFSEYNSYPYLKCVNKEVLVVCDCLL
ncbi:hypothetical protein GDO81_018669 [Engystomops pustulosus]|uniref:ATP synthase F0 subunit 8 n=1 Tax=Engystomops pustulosus TaxID=76066 RepID=A0AAV6YBZ7_ENGPU|nr:hypothetical protein GDO81_018669 [Engystomops pustulosus]